MSVFLVVGAGRTGGAGSPRVMGAGRLRETGYPRQGGGGGGAGRNGKNCAPLAHYFALPYPISELANQKPCLLS